MSTTTILLITQTVSDPSFLKRFCGLHLAFPIFCIRKPFHFLLSLSSLISNMWSTKLLWKCTYHLHNYECQQLCEISSSFFFLTSKVGYQLKTIVMHCFSPIYPLCICQHFSLQYIDTFVNFDESFFTEFKVDMFMSSLTPEFTSCVVIVYQHDLYHQRNSYKGLEYFIRNINKYIHIFHTTDWLDSIFINIVLMKNLTMKNRRQKIKTSISAPFVL